MIPFRVYPATACGLTSGTTSGNLRVHAPGAGVVDDHAAVLGGVGGERSLVLPPAEKSAMSMPLKEFSVSCFDIDQIALEPQLPPDRPRRGQQPNGLHRKIGFLEAGDHLVPDRSRRAGHGDVEFLLAHVRCLLRHPIRHRCDRWRKVHGGLRCWARAIEKLPIMEVPALTLSPTDTAEADVARQVDVQARTEADHAEALAAPHGVIAAARGR